MKYFVIISSNKLEPEDEGDRGFYLHLFNTFDEAFEFSKKCNGIIYKGLEIVNFSKE